ncbi:uncharacterized protein LOC142505019 [Primulina tabacum]|uniref:uncharacterized protein LOC142505019 n=1 Tax=Primulina tabacum TaxID=48773 RepID=UPI003F5A5A89
MRFGHKGKLAPRYICPYVIVERIGTLSYRLDLPPSLSLIHNVFHVSMLRKDEPDLSHILNVEDVELDSSLSYVEHPVQILDRKEKQLRSKTITLVLVQWSRHGREESTWELEAKMRQEWPHLFENLIFQIVNSVSGDISGGLLLRDHYCVFKLRFMRFYRWTSSSDIP